MTGLNHAATGAVVAVIVREPWLALPLALASHFVCDSLPHWNYWLPGQKKFQKWVLFSDMLLGVLLAVVLGFSISGGYWWLVTACGLTAMAPDLLWLINFVLGKPTPANNKSILHRVRRLHLKIQWSETSFGLAIEMLWFSTMLQAFLLLGNE